MSDREIKGFEAGPGLPHLSEEPEVDADIIVGSYNSGSSLRYEVWSRYLQTRSPVENLQDLDRAARAARGIEEILNDAAAALRNQVLPVEEHGYEFFSGEFDAGGFLTSESVMHAPDLLAGGAIGAVQQGPDFAPEREGLQEFGGSPLGTGRVMVAAGIPAATMGAGAVLTALAFTGQGIQVNPYVALFVLLGGIVLTVTAVLALRDYL